MVIDCKFLLKYNFFYISHSNIIYNECNIKYQTFDILIPIKLKHNDQLGNRFF